MSYCVNCGVELKESERICPLCMTEVMNPNKPWTEPEAYPFPKHVEAFRRRVDKRYFASFVSALLLIPLLVTAFCDYMMAGGLTWSLYVAGALAVVFVCVLLPFLVRKRNLLTLILADCAVLIGYLALIEYLTGGSWFLKLGMPVTFIASAFTIVLTLVFGLPRKNAGTLVKMAAILFATGLFTVCVEIVINAWRDKPLIPSWSVYALVPCLIVGVCVLIFNRRIKLKEELRRRFFI